MFIYLEGCDRNDENARDLEGREVDGDRSEVRGDEGDLEDSHDLEGRKIVGGVVETSRAASSTAA